MLKQRQISSLVLETSCLASRLFLLNVYLLSNIVREVAVVVLVSQSQWTLSVLFILTESVGLVFVDSWSARKLLLRLCVSD